jgi:ABC-type tungstate transport system permease subunit
MAEVITMATEVRAYAITDRGTYIALRHGNADLEILFEGKRVSSIPTASSR